MDPKVAAVLKWALYGLFAFAVFIFASKYHKRETRKDAVVAEMRSLVSEANFYRAISEKDARTTFLRAIALLHDGKALGMEPSAVFDGVFEREKGKSADDEFDDYPTREKLARESLTRAYQHAGQLGLLAGAQAVAELKQGVLPASETKAAIVCVIDPEIAPGLDKVVPNFELRAFDNQNATPSDVDIAAALKLASDLASSQVIDRAAETRIANHFRPKEAK